MENEPELIRDQMQETRTALTEKLDTLQQKVADTVESITAPVTETVQTVKEAVSDTVDTVKETVSGTVESIKETFNLSHQVEQHPWPMMFGSFATGFVLGRLLPPPGRVFDTITQPRTHPVAAAMSQPREEPNGFRQEYAPREAARTSKPGLLSGLGEAIEGELNKLKGLGVSVGVGLLRDLMTRSMHGEIGDRIKEFMDDVTQKLGGKPLSEPLVAQETGQEEKPAEESKSETFDPKARSEEWKSPHEPIRRW